MNIETNSYFDLEFKLITLGEAGVGKTSIINRFVNNSFFGDTKPTMGIQHFFKIIKMPNGKALKFSIIDTSGQEKYRSLPTSYFRNVEVVLFIFDLNCKLSFENMEKWIHTFNENNNGKYIKKQYLIGNKNDLEQKVGQNLIDEFSEKNNLPYWGISAKTSNQVNDLFQSIANDLYEDDKRNNISSKSRGSRIVSRPQTNDKKKKGCCN